MQRSHLHLAFVVVVSAALRVFHLGSRDFWYDEAFTGNAIREAWGPFFRLLSGDFHPPLYYVLLKIWSMGFGSGVVALRSFSVLFGVATVVAIFYLARKLFNEKIALIATWFVALSPFLIQYAQETRMYAMLAFLSLLATWEFLNLLELHGTSVIPAKAGIQWTRVVRFGIVLGLAWLTHYTAFVFTASLFVGGVLSQRIRLKHLIPLLASLLIAVAVFFPWIPSFISQVNVLAETQNTAVTVFPRDAWTDFGVFFFGIPKGEMSAGFVITNPVRWIPVHLGIFAIVLVALWAMFRLWRRSYQDFSFVASIAFLPFFVIAFIAWRNIHFTNPRYLIFAAPFVYLVLATALDRWKWRSVAILLGSVTVAFFVFVRPPENSQGYNQMLANADQYRESHFYSLNTFDYMIATYYFGKDRVTLYNSSWPEFNPSGWPGLVDVHRTTDRSVMDRDPNGIILWDVHLPLEYRDDRNFDPLPYPHIARYQNLEVYRSLRK